MDEIYRVVNMDTEWMNGTRQENTVVSDDDNDEEEIETGNKGTITTQHRETERAMAISVRSKFE